MDVVYLRYVRQPVPPCVHGVYGGRTSSAVLLHVMGGPKAANTRRKQAGNEPHQLFLTRYAATARQIRVRGIAVLVLRRVEDGLYRDTAEPISERYTI